MQENIDEMVRKAGSTAGSSRTVSQEERPRPGGAEPETGDGNKELRWAQRMVPEDEPVLKPVKSVFRKTELHGAAPPATPEGKKKTRNRTEKNLKNPQGEIPYRQFETAARDFLCSIMERQDLIRDEALLRVADLQQRMDALEERVEQVRRAAAVNPTMNG